MLKLTNHFLVGAIIISEFVLVTNYLNVHQYLEFFASPKLSVRLFGYFVYSFIILLVFACCGVVLGALLK